MTEGRNNLPLSRGDWTLARYLSERAPEPRPPIVHAHDDILHVAKLAVGAARSRAVYVVDEHGRYVGTITDRNLAREVFSRLDPGLYVNEHAHAKLKISRLSEDATRLTAQSLITVRQRPLRALDTLAESMSVLYGADNDELPVVSETNHLVGVIRVHDILREWVEDTLLVRLGDETESFY